MGVVGPTLLDEATEEQLRQRLESEAQAQWRQRIRQAIADSNTFSTNDWPDDDSDPVVVTFEPDVSDDRHWELGLYSKPRIHRHSLDAIILQFKALGIISSSDRKRSVNDTQTYWALTPHGEWLTVRQGAIRRADLPSDN